MKKIFIILFATLLILGNILFAWRYVVTSRRADNLSAQARVVQSNRGMVDFALLFIGKVLRANGEVDFETRLLMENKVRALNDAQVLSAWQVFTGSKTETEAQERVKNLLELLFKKLEVS